VKKLQKLFLFSLIGLVFVGSVGISVFGHLCSVNGEEISFFAPIEETCKPVVEEKSCCHAPKEISKSENNFKAEKCCTESFSYYKISTENTDRILDLKFSPKYTNAFFFFPEIFPTVFEKEIQIAKYYPDPPQKSGKEILIAFQVFRI
jgi:hypothetical protein